MNAYIYIKNLQKALRPNDSKAIMYHHSVLVSTKQKNEIHDICLGISKKYLSSLKIYIHVLYCNIFHHHEDMTHIDMLQGMC